MSRKDALILPTRERQDKDEVVLEETGRAGVYAMRVTTQTPLDRLYKRELIDSKQYDAGNRLRKLYYFARGAAKVTAKYEDSPRIASDDMQEARHRALVDLRETFRQLGKEYSSILEAVCCEDLSPTDWAHRARKASPTHQAPLLREALNALASYWRL